MNKRYTRLSDIVEIISGGTPKTSIPEYWDGNIPWLSVNDFAGDSRWVYSAEKSITDLGVRKSSTKILNKGDLIISARGTVGELAELAVPMAFNQSCFGLRGKNNTDTEYLYYLLKYNMPKIKIVANGATFGTIVLDTFDRIKIESVKDLPTQQKIAGILSKYDEAIENNNKRIKLLEQMAQNLYKEWFVRFRFPGWQNAEFENGIPKGWKVARVGEYVKIKSGFAFKSEWWQEEGCPVVKIKDIDNGTLDTSELDCVSEEYAAKAKSFLLHEGDLVIAMTGATIGKIGLIPKINNLYTNQRVGKFFLGENPFEKMPIMYCLFSQFATVEMILCLSGASSAQPNISPEQLESIKFFYEERIVEKFNKETAPFFKMILKLRECNQNLSRQRDLLLPRLMSGKLQVFRK